MVDAQTLRNIAKQAPSRVIDRGDVYIVEPSHLSLPADSSGAGAGKKRRVVVMQDRIATICKGTALILVAPTSTTVSGGEFDWEPPDGDLENGFTEAATIFVSQTQPVLLSALTQKVGTVSESCQHDLINCMLRLMGTL